MFGAGWVFHAHAGSFSIGLACAGRFRGLHADGETWAAATSMGRLRAAWRVWRPSRRWAAPNRAGRLSHVVVRGRDNPMTDPVSISLGGVTEAALIGLPMPKVNDGFSTDDVAPAPLPLAGLALLAGLGALVVVRRRRVANA
jgi:MYXO-CTERM domain-containing protein